MFAKKKQNETTVVFQPIDFQTTPSETFSEDNDLSENQPAKNQPSKVISASSCKVDDGIAEVMPRLARSKFPLVFEGRKNCEVKTWLHLQNEGIFCPITR